jgi:hypothetical protein
MVVGVYGVRGSKSTALLLQGRHTQSMKTASLSTREDVWSLYICNGWSFLFFFLVSRTIGSHSGLSI